MKRALRTIAMIASLLILLFGLLGLRGSYAPPSVHFPEGGVWTELDTGSAAYIITNRQGWLTVHRISALHAPMTRVLIFPWWPVVVLGLVAPAILITRILKRRQQCKQT